MYVHKFHSLTTFLILKSNLKFSQTFSNMCNVLHFFRLALDAIVEIHVQRRKYVMTRAVDKYAVRDSFKLSGSLQKFV